MTSRSRYDRRRFLAGLGTAVTGSVALPTILPGTALGLDRLAAASERVTVGMIGTGRQTFLVNLPQFLAMPDVQVVAICDVDDWRLSATAEKVASAHADRNAAGSYRACQSYTDYRQLLEHQDLDAVMIATPDHWHVPQAIEAARAGKHVSLEKPITRTVAEGQRLIQAIQQHDRVFRMDSEMRSHAWLHRLAEIVRNGGVGTVKAVRVGVPAGDDVACPPTPEMPVPEDLDYASWLGPAPHAPYTQERVHPPKQFGRPGWMRVLDYSDGMITNWGTHFWDIAQWCLDTERTGPVTIQGTGKWPPPGQLWDVLQRFEVEYRLDDGTELYYENTRAPEISGAMGGCSAYVKIEGSEGWIYAAFGPQQLVAEPAGILDMKIDASGVRFPLKSDKQDFIDAIKTGSRTLQDEIVAHRTTSLCHLGHIAVRLEQELHWDPVRETFTNNDEANRYLSRPMSS
jgi:myo-inositol 2-dehydrogenase / D-chiro-inositol 1-dehydrogenase